MTKKDFFTTIIKLFGLYSAIITLFVYLPQNLNYSIGVSNTGELLGSVATFFLFACITIGLFLVVVFNAGRIADLLKLDKGFDDDFIKIDQLDNLSIMKFAIILIGGYMIVSNIPELLTYLYYTFRAAAKVTIFEGSNIGGFQDVQMIISALSILVGYLLMTNYKKLANWLNK